jgi:prepilin-type N-terminal cleavage/methylation domain-containing protein
MCDAESCPLLHSTGPRKLSPIGMRRRRPGGFTLVELLVVVSILALLIAILLPSLRSARDTAKRTLCQANMHALALGFTIYVGEYQGRYPAGYSLWDAPWGAGDMFWHQRLIEEGLAYGKEGPKKNNAVCPADPKPWTPYTYTPDEKLIYNTSYGANPVVMIADGHNKIGQKISDGIDDWVGWLYEGRMHTLVDDIRYPAYLVLVTEVEGPSSPFFFEPWSPNKDEGQDGEWAWGRHDRNFNETTGGFLNMLHADGSVTHSAVNSRVYGLGEDDKDYESLARKLVLPEGDTRPESERH